MFKNLRKKVTDDFGQPSLPTPIQRMYQGDHDSASEMSSIADPGTMSKQEILALYQRSCTKYNKYKGRYSDLIRSFRTLEADHKRLQDERRGQQRCVSELREQCHLEQQAKAHMEDTLRTDLEERDETIRLLRLKVQLVHDGNNSTSSHVPSSAETHCDDQLVVLHTDEDEVTSIKEKLDRRERLLVECQDRLKQGESRSSSLLNEKHQLQQRLTELQHTMNAERESHKSELSRLESLVCELRQRMASSQQEQLSTVENQTVLQQDMQRKDEQLQQLRTELEDKRAAVDRLEQQVTGLNTELTNTRADNRKALHELERVSEEEKASLVQELSRGKQEALRVLETELESRLADEWGRRLQLREDQLMAEIRDCREQLHLAAEEQQLQQTAASSNQQLNTDRHQLTTALESLRLEKSGLESRVAQLEATHAAALEQCRRQADHQLQELRTRAEAAEAKQQQQTMQMAAEAEDTKLKEEKMNREVVDVIEGSADSMLKTETVQVTIAQQHSAEISSLREEHEAITAELRRQLAAYKAASGGCEVDSDARPAVSTDQHHTEAESIGAEAAAEVERLQVEGVRLQEQIVMLKQQLEERLQERMRMVEEHQSELEQLRTARTELDDALTTARSDLDTTSERCSDLEYQVVSLKASAEEDQRQLQVLKEEREEMGKRLESAEAERQILYADLSSMIDERFQIQSELVSTDNEKKGLQSCLESAEKEREHLQQRLILEENDKQQVLTRALAAENNENLLRLQLASMENDRKELQKTLDTVEESRNQLRDLLKAAEVEVTEQRSKLAEAEESLAALRNCDAGKSEEMSRLIASLEEARESEARARSDADSRSQELCKAGVELESVLVAASATQQRLSELGSQLTLAQSEVADTGKHAADLTGQLSAALAAAEDARQQLQTAAVQQQQLEERLAEKQRQFAAATASAQQLEQRLERQLVDRQEAARQAEQCQLQMRNAQNELATVQAARHGLESESHRLRDELADLSVTRTHLEQDLAVWKQKLRVAEGERERLEARVEVLTTDLQEAEQGLETALRSRGHMEGRLEQLEQLAEQSSRWRTERDQLEARVAELEEWNIPETEQWAEERHLLQARFEQLQRDHEEAEQQRDSLSKTVQELQLLQKQGIVRHTGTTATEKIPPLSSSPTLGNNTDYGAGERIALSSPSPPFDDNALVNMLDSCGDHMTAGGGEHAVNTTEGGDSGAGEGGMATSSTAAVSECQWTSMQRRVAHQKQEIRRLTGRLSQINSKHICEVSELRRLLELGQQKPSTIASSTPSSAAPTAVLNLQNDDGDDIATLHPLVEGAGSSDPHFLTELEYLRNILYEYMMGKEPVTLAKVIAAVVKFDDDQTRMVLEREQTRQSAVSNASSVGSTLYSISPFKWR